MLAPKSLRFRGVITATAIAWATAGAHAQSAEEFYRGKKELNLITSSSVGGGYDQYSRLVARHMGKYLPGNPTIIVQNMVGGGGIRAANYIYNVAPRDGTSSASSTAACRRRRCSTATSRRRASMP